MKIFPKKYKPQDLRNRAKSYREHVNNTDKKIDDYTFSPGTISISKKILYNDFFPIYLRDFFNCRNNLKNKELFPNNPEIFQQLFTASSNHLKSICNEYEFFNKKNQTLSQVGTIKFKRRTISIFKKNLNTNNKIIESYLSSPHKIYIPDSGLYIYILNLIHSLRENGKLVNKTKIGYRSFNLQTSIPLHHITRKEEKKPYYILKYFIGAKCEALPVYVEDIDLCCGDVALLVHPKDKRYNKYIGKNAIIPLCNRQIPIIGDENVNIAINNGIKRICPCADQESIALAEKYNLPLDVYVFNPQGLYTESIHEPAFIGQERSKYYNNIEEFIENIGNLAEKGEKLVKTPYLDYINERLTPYKINQFIIDLKQEKQRIIERIFNKSLNFSFLNSEFSEIFDEIINLQKTIDETNNDTDGDNYNSSLLNTDEDYLDELQKQILQLKQRILNELNKYLPNHFIINNQLKYNRRFPFLKDSDGSFSFFDIEKDCLKWKDKPLQFCFNFILLCFIRIGILGTKKITKDNKFKLCEHDKLITIFSENEKKIENFIKHLSEITGEKPEYNDFLNIIQNLNNDSRIVNNFKKLIDNSKFIKKYEEQLILDMEGGLINDTIDQDFIQLCIPCYFNNKNIKINDKIIYNKEDRTKIFQEILLQELIIGDSLSHNYLEYYYNKNAEFLGNKQLSKLQLEQSQRDLFLIYGENPIRLNFLINQTYDQKEILLNNIFLKQIWNAARLCIQKEFLPKDIKETLQKGPKNLEDFDIGILNKLNEQYNYRKDVETYEDYTKFFLDFKSSIQDTFFSRYLEIQKANTTKNVQFVCAYLFNFLSTILYPLVPEFVDALQYITERKFLLPVCNINLDKSVTYNMKILYKSFIKIKEIKIECNIKQHEPCNIFIKSIPTIGDIFAENEQILKNYFHISEIIYIRSHEPNPLGYEIFSDDTVTIGIQHGASESPKEKVSIETLERDIKNLDDKLTLLRQRIQILPEGEERSKAEEEYANTKEEMENLSIKHSLLSSK